MPETVVIPCVDKEYLHDDKNPLLPSCGEKIILSGRSGSGKGVAVKNIIGRLNPPAERIVVLHGDPQGTQEWLDCDAEMRGIDELPDLQWDRKVKNVLIIDEIPIDSLPKAQRSEIERYHNYRASHYGIMIFLLSQSFYSSPTCIRRAADRWIIWPGVDETFNRDVQAKTGHNMRDLKKLCESKYDNITFNFTGRGPALLFNLFEPIEDDHGE